MKKIFKILSYTLLLCASVWCILYAIQTLNNPFSSKEKNITRVNISIIHAYETRKNEVLSIFSKFGQQNQALPNIPKRHDDTTSQPKRLHTSF